MKKYLPKDHTFVICAYRNSPYLEECICSLLSQNVKSRVILSTSTPNDDIFTLCDTYSIPAYINKGEVGIAGDWNFALSCAETALVTLAHQDDLYEPDYVSEMLKCMNHTKMPLLFFSNYCELRNDTKVSKGPLLRTKKAMSFPVWLFPQSVAARRLSLAFGNSICCPSVTYVRDLMKEYPFEAGLKSNLDWLQWEKLSLLKGSFVYSRRRLMCHRIHEGSETSRMLRENARTGEDYEVFLKFWPEPLAGMIAGIYANGEKGNDL